MIPAIILVCLTVIWRVVLVSFIHSGAGWLSNFAPLAAIALCGAAYFPPKLKFGVPLGALFISDVILNYHYGASLADPHILCRYFTLALIGFFGLALQNRASLKTLLPASLASSTFFYVVTIFFSWLSDPGYVKNFAGLIQALTIGLPQYSATPSWMFFRNSLLSDLFFTVLFVACMKFARNHERITTAAALPRVA
jgi:hypothetical protein